VFGRDGHAGHLHRKSSVLFFEYEHVTVVCLTMLAVPVDLHELPEIWVGVWARSDNIGLIVFSERALLNVQTRMLGFACSTHPECDYAGCVS
jgi:hypothetical protein